MMYNRGVPVTGLSPSGTRQTWRSAMKRVARVCSIDGCELIYSCGGFCKKHYDYNKKNGTPFPTIIVNDDQKRFWSKVEKTDGCWFWRGTVLTNGYGQFSTKARRWSAHRYSYRLDKSEIPRGLLVCHSCDIPTCVNPEHLWLGTTRDNAQDMVGKGRDKPPKGEKQGSSKFTASQVLEIREKHSNGFTPTQLAKLYGTTPGYVNSLVRRITWRHI